MESPFYIYERKSGYDRHWSGPWETQEMLDAVLSEAKAIYPEKSLMVCGSSLSYRHETFFENGSAPFKHEPPIVFTGPNFQDFPER